jgi:hypothetical protein
MPFTLTMDTVSLSVILLASTSGKDSVQPLLLNGREISFYRRIVKILN